MKARSLTKLFGAIGLCALAVATFAPISSAATPFPGCSWPVESTPTTANIFYPDSNSTYWTTPYRVKPGMKIYLRGAYPTARYFSVTAYDSNAQPFAVNSVGSSLTDYQIAPSVGRNPWSVGAWTATASGLYSITLRSLTGTGGVTGSLRNTLPIAPKYPAAGYLPADIGFIMVRVYLPPELNFAAISLPSITIKEAGKQAVTLKRCGGGEGTRKLNLSGVGRKILKLLKGGTAPAKPPCPPGQKGCPPNLAFFVPPSGSDIPFPNTTSGYAAAFFTPQQGKVVVIKAKIPTSPYDYGSGRGSGELPVPWPRNDAARWQVRYWSLCNYVYQAPYPVVVAPGANGTTIYGCVADLQSPTTADSTITAVLSYPADRPVNATYANGIAWLPMSTSTPNAVEQVSLRNMLVASTFKTTPKSATGESVAAAKKAMGAYYPQAAMCTTVTFESGGAAACFASG
ncbi:MAG: hypothetical protein NTV40_04835 [Solirubrobacterales bacterium]|nr:hypothetical protein [Solirubrobacterales bacterium]